MPDVARPSDAPDAPHALAWLQAAAMILAEEAMAADDSLDGELGVLNGLVAARPAAGPAALDALGGELGEVAKLDLARLRAERRVRRPARAPLASRPRAPLASRAPRATRAAAAVAVVLSAQALAPVAPAAAAPAERAARPAAQAAKRAPVPLWLVDAQTREPIAFALIRTADEDVVAFTDEAGRALVPVESLTEPVLILEHEVYRLTVIDVERLAARVPFTMDRMPSADAPALAVEPARAAPARPAPPEAAPAEATPAAPVAEPVVAAAEPVMTAAAPAARPTSRRRPERVVIQAERVTAQAGHAVAEVEPAVVPVERPVPAAAPTSAAMAAAPTTVARLALPAAPIRPADLATGQGRVTAPAGDRVQAGPIPVQPATAVVPAPAAQPAAPPVQVAAQPAPARRARAITLMDLVRAVLPAHDPAQPAAPAYEGLPRADEHPASTVLDEPPIFPVDLPVVVETPGLAAAEAAAARLGPAMPAAPRPAATAASAARQAAVRARVAQAPRADLYVVRRGDTLGTIARRELGSAKRWRELLAANADVLRSPHRLEPKMALRIPRAPRDVAEAVRIAGEARAAAALAALGYPMPERPAGGARARGRTARAEAVKPAPRPAAAPVALKPASAPTTTGGATYVVQPGDSLSSIAGVALGSRKRWHELWQANRQAVRRPTRIRVGQVLVLPGVPAAAKRAAKPRPALETWTVFTPEPDVRPHAVQLPRAVEPFLDPSVP